MTTLKQHIFDLQSTHNKARYLLPIERHICVGPPERQFLFGGVGLAAAISALEAASDRPVVWATGQYLSYARPGETLDLDVKMPVIGNQITQARVVAHVEDREIFTVNGALGRRDIPQAGQWAAMPEAEAPEHYPTIRVWDGRDDLHSNFETRLVKGRYGAERNTGVASDDGHIVMWARMKNDYPINAGALAIIADFVPSATGHALGLDAGANSLDNTVRVVGLVPTQWVLCDIRIHGIRGGFVHGRMLIFAETGELMATASQSAILRVW
jgi:acyl-CoA thioesterase-2